MNNSKDTPPEMHVVPGVVVREILDSMQGKIVDLAGAVYVSHVEGNTVNPDSYFLLFPKEPKNRIIALPSSYDDEALKLSGIKWIASFPDNIHSGLARASAVIVLNQASNGYPYAFMEAATISSSRTAASAVLGARHCSTKGKNIKKLGVIGSGIIGKTTIEVFFKDNWNIDEVAIFDLNRQSAEGLASQISDGFQTKAKAAESLEEATSCDVVLFVTSAGEPYVLDPNTFKAGQVVLNISLRDIAPEIILNACNVFDDVEHCMKANTSPHLAEQLSGGRDFVTGTIGEIIKGEVSLDHSKPIIYSPFGLGVLDLIFANKIYEIAKEAGTSIPIANFFGETERW